MEILIINQPLNNRGDESAHKGLIRALCNSVPNINIKVLFVGVNQDSINQFNVNQPNVEYINLHAIKAYSRLSILGLKYGMPLLWYIHPTIRKVINLYKNADSIICAPGGICMGGFQNWMHLFALKLAKHLNKPLIYYGRSFGPFPTKTQNNRIFKKISLEMLNYFSFLSIRDKESEKLARQLNIKYVPTVDSAFLDSPKVDLPEEIKHIITNHKYMVFVPNSLIWHYHYKNSLTKESVIKFYQQIISLIRNLYPDLNIVMLPQTFNYGTYLGDDINFFRDLANEINDEHIIIIKDKYSSDIQQTIISNAEFLIGARYHSIVFALNNNIPFIALSYEHKISGLLETLKKADRIVDITGLSNECNSSQITLIENLLQTLEKDKNTQEKAKNIAFNCFDKLVIYLNSF